MSLLTLRRRSFCRLWYYWSLHSLSSFLLLVQHHRYCSCNIFQCYLSSHSCNIFQCYLSSRSFCISLILPQPHFNFLVAYLKDLFMGQLFSTCILHHLVISSPSNLSITISMPTTFNSLSLSCQKTFITAVTQLQDTISDISSWMTSNLLSQTLLKLNSCLLVFLNKYPK